jgi:predicted metal-dependent phosphoesterase TrpH
MIVTSGQPKTHTRQLTGRAQDLQRIFTQVSVDSCPHTFNFHMHTNCSDGKLTPSELMEQAIDIGLKAFAITDHHTVDGYYRAKTWLEDWQWRNPRTCRFSGNGRGRQPQTPRLFTGVEITASMFGTEVHILGYGFTPSHDAIESYLHHTAPRGDAMAAAAVVEAIQSAGGLAVLAHPARYKVSADVLVPEAARLGFDGVEAYYAYSNPKQWHPCPEQTPKVRAMAAQHQLLTTCGTDTHGRSLLRRI